ALQAIESSPRPHEGFLGQILRHGAAFTDPVSVAIDVVVVLLDQRFISEALVRGPISDRTVITFFQSDEQAAGGQGGVRSGERPGINAHPWGGKKAWEMDK